MKLLEDLITPANLIFIGAIISATGAIWAAQRQASSEIELRKKSEEIADLNKRIAASITGGNSFAYITLVSQNPPVFTVVHQGEYPLYDLTVRIVDLDKFDQFKSHRPTSIFDLQKDEVHLNIGNLAPSAAQIIGHLTAHQSTRWNIFFSARNGFFSQNLRIQKVNNEWKTAVRVLRDNKGLGQETLFERVDPGYPVNEHGQVKWD